MAARILTIDIETSPAIAMVWGLWNQNIGINQILDNGGMISFAAKWHGEREVIFRSRHHDGHDEMVRTVRDLLDEADIVVHYNGDSFDTPKINQEIERLQLEIPSPFLTIDLIKTVKKEFNLLSNKLDYVLQYFGIGAKIANEGMPLWRKCVIEDDPRAWEKMKRYNIGDTKQTEKLYDRLRPRIIRHPNMANFAQIEGEACPVCTGSNLERRGYKPYASLIYPQYRCKDCGKWSRGRKALPQRSELVVA